MIGKLFIAILSLFLVLLQLRLWNSVPGSILDNIQLKKKVLAESAEVQRFNLRNRQLEAEVSSLKSKNPEAFEERARTELGMIKPGETFCLIVEP